MVLFLYKSLQNCIKKFNINSLTDFKNFVYAKNLNVLETACRNCVLVYYDNELKIGIVNKITREFIYLHNNVISTNNKYVALKLKRHYNAMQITIQTIIFMTIIGLFIYDPILSVMFLVFLLLTEHNSFILQIFLCAICLANIGFYDKYFSLAALPLVLLKNKHGLILSTIFLVDLSNHNELFFIYLTYVFCMISTMRKDLLKFKNWCNKLESPVKINQVNYITVENNNCYKPGYYFLLYQDSGEVFVNKINLKYIEISSLNNKIKVIHIINHNSFFTNRAKYSKIDSSEKFYIFLHKISTEV